MIITTTIIIITVITITEIVIIVNFSFFGGFAKMRQICES